MLRRNLHFAPKSVKNKAFVSCVLPIVEYASTCWSPNSQKMTNLLEMVQHNGAKFVTNKYPQKGNFNDFSISKILENLNQYIQSQDPIFFKNFISNKISMFPYQKNYAQRNSSFISGHFGEKTAAAIFSFPPSDLWQGPIVSPFGYHLLKVSSLTTKKQKTFAEVRSLVKEKVKDNKRKESLRLELEKKISSYNIIEY